MKTKVLLSIFLFIIGLTLNAQCVKAIEYGQMGGRPTNYDPDIPDSQSWFIYNLDPGTTKEDSLTVANLFEDSWVAVIYAADSVKSSSGGFALRQVTEAKEAVGSWVKFYPDPKPDFANKVFEDKKTIDEVCKVSSEDLEKNYELDGGKITELGEWCKGVDLVELDLKSGEKKELAFVITIPRDADVGEHTGGILIQKKAKDETSQNDGSKVMLTTRVGVRIYETVPGNIIKKLTFSDFKVAKNFEEFYLPWDKIKKEKFKEYLITSLVKNSGNASTDFNEKINIHNIITGKTESLDVREFQVLRGDDFISSLSWKAPRLAYLNFQKEYRYKNTNGDDEIIQSEAIKKWFIPWRELSILTFFALLAAVGYILWRRHQNKYYGGIGWVEYEVEEGDTVQGLMKKFAVEWKAFVKTNKIKKPYILEVGQLLLVPKSITGEDSDSFHVDGGVVEPPSVKKTVSKNIINLRAKENIQEVGSLEQEVIDENNIELDEIANEADFSINSSADSIIGDPDTVDSSLFFGEKAEGDESQAEAIQEDVQVEFEVRKEDFPKKKPVVKPLAKKTKAEEKASIEEEIRNDYREEEINGDEELLIKGEKSDSKGAHTWLIYLLLTVIIILLAGIGFLLFQNKKMLSMKASNQPEIIVEDKIEAPIESEESAPADVQPEEEIAPQEEISIKTSDINVKVLNGSGVAGAAGKVKDFLVDREYKSVEAGNYSSETVEGTIIYYNEDNLKVEAQWISDMLKDKEIDSEIKAASSEEEKSADVVVILGK